ncbi:MAG: S1C family serine protease [Halorientalis sp.]
MDQRLTRRGFLAATGLAAGLAGCNAPATREETTTDGETTVLDTTPVSQSVFTDVYRRTIDSVVMVRVYDRSGAGGQGSGFVYDQHHVVTNQHVVAGADSVQVRFTDGRWADASVVGTDVYSDLAVLRVEDMPASATPLELMSGGVAPGQRVLAIGNPYGLSGSVSSGIVSGVGRAIPASASGAGPDFSIPNAIQTDAAVNPGNSGGPLVTLDGTVAGVINSGGGENIGFAISAPLVRRVVPALVETGNYEHSYMGVRLTNVIPRLATANSLDSATGVYIDDVVEGGPSDGVLQGTTGSTVVRGIETATGGDVVVRMGEEPTPSRQRLATYLALETSPGDTIPVRIIRDGREQTVDLTLGDRPEPS